MMRPGFLAGFDGFFDDMFRRMTGAPRKMAKGATKMPGRMVDTGSAVAKGATKMPGRMVDTGKKVGSAMVGTGRKVGGAMVAAPGRMMKVAEKPVKRKSYRERRKDRRIKRCVDRGWCPPPPPCPPCNGAVASPFGIG